jgi:polysaccharide export outer membrane protein
MKTVVASALFGCWLVAQQSSPETPAAPAGNLLARSYRIGPGDVLQVSVWREPEASVPTVVVRPDGSINLPLVKEVPVVGLTPGEAEAALTEQFGRYIRAPGVTVVVKEIHSSKVYLLGAVKKEGPILLQGPTTVLQALAEAGGLTDYAKRKKIYILRTESQKRTRLPFNYDAVIRGERADLDIQLLPGDTIVVPE